VISVQYLRVVVVLVTVPVVAPLLGPGPGAGAGETVADSAGGLAGLGFTATAVLGGVLLSRLARFAASGILMPLLVSTVLPVTGVFPSTAMPGWVAVIGYTIVGLMVGLGFTRRRLRVLTRLLPLALAQIALSIAACAGVGLLMAQAIGVPALDGYLATTPGGLPAVVAVAVDSSAGLGLVVTMQVVRLFVSLLAAAAAGTWIRRRRL
jgi:membrane AbrB-like protein